MSYWGLDGGHTSVLSVVRTNVTACSNRNARQAVEKLPKAPLPASCHILEQRSTQHARPLRAGIRRPCPTQFFPFFQKAGGPAGPRVEASSGKMLNPQLTPTIHTHTL